MGVGQSQSQHIFGTANCAACDALMKVHYDVHHENYDLA